MKIFIAIALFACVGLSQAGHGVVTPDIIHHVSKVLSHGYGSKVVLDFPQKAFLVDYGHSVHHDYGHYGGHYGGYGGHYGGGYGHGHGHGGHYGGGGHSGGGYGHGHGHYAAPAYFGGYGGHHGHHGHHGHRGHY